MTKRNKPTDRFKDYEEDDLGKTPKTPEPVAATKPEEFRDSFNNRLDGSNPDRPTLGAVSAVGGPAPKGDPGRKPPRKAGHTYRGEPLAPGYTDEMYLADLERMKEYGRATGNRVRSDSELREARDKRNIDAAFPKAEDK